MGFDLNALVRENIKALKPYSSARDEFSGSAKVFLDANENPVETGLNRYPDPRQQNLKERLAQIKGVIPEQIFVGNGSDEAIDLIIRAFCEPGADRVAQLAPTYGMYRVCADIQGIPTQNIPMAPGFDLDALDALRLIHENTKVLFLCSPNNPTGNSLTESEVLKLVESFKGLVVIDEAYIDFSPNPSYSRFLASYPNLIVLQTLSKAWGLAGIRMGLAIASKEIIDLLSKIKYPYNVNTLSIQKALEVLGDVKNMQAEVTKILEQKVLLGETLKKFDFVHEVFPSDANFLLVRFEDPQKIYAYLLSRDIVVRDRSKVPGLDGCLRLTVGTSEDNIKLISALQSL